MSSSTPALPDYLRWMRSLVGQRKIFLSYSSVILFDDAGRILLQRRSDFDVWGLPGGVHEPGETIIECARRELAEESGLRAGRLRLAGVYSEPEYDVTYPNGDQVQQFTTCLAGRWRGGEMCVDGVETRAQRFFAPAELPWAEIPPWYSAMLRDGAILRDGLAGTTAFHPPVSREPLQSQILTVRAHVGHAAFMGVGAVAVVRRPDGRILAIQRSDDRGWCLPGGYSDLGENAAHTAQRETREETGLEVTPTRLLGVFSPRPAWDYPNGDRLHAVAAVIECAAQAAMTTADGDEALQAAWLDPQELIARGHVRQQALHRALSEGRVGFIVDEQEILEADDATT